MKNKSVKNTNYINILLLNIISIKKNKFNYFIFNNINFKI